MTNKPNILSLKNLHNMSISVKCIIWQIFNEIVENQDSYLSKEITQITQIKYMYSRVSPKN